MAEYIERERLIKWAREFFPSTLNLINCQKLEIEQWKEEANRWQNAWCEAVDDIQIAKSATIKEFAEMLKSKIWHSPECNYIRSITPDYIDNLVKEMTEGKE